jgi:hypothetical protein
MWILLQISILYWIRAILLEKELTALCYVYMLTKANGRLRGGADVSVWPLNTTVMSVVPSLAT